MGPSSGTTLPGVPEPVPPSPVSPPSVVAVAPLVARAAPSCASPSTSLPASSPAPARNPPPEDAVPAMAARVPGRVGGEGEGAGAGAATVVAAGCGDRSVAPRIARRGPPALVAQWIEHRPPEPGAQVRVLPRAPAVTMPNSTTALARSPVVPRSGATGSGTRSAPSCPKWTTPPGVKDGPIIAP